jgi:site-specific DNA-methyltransferase (cytosine-N4-specific)
MKGVITDNSHGLPEKEAELCATLADALNDNDGFRRQAVPALLYRYFQGMQAAFSSIRPSMRSGAKFALIVGHNHTTLGGRRFDIDTPLHLANLATSAGWELDELLPLQTYQRFGLHMTNAVASETLILLTAR